MINKDILNKIEFFSRCIKHSVVELKEVRCKHQNQHKMIDTWTAISQIHLGFRLDSEEIMNKPNLTDLPITGCFCEASDIIENLKIRADTAMDDAGNDNYSDYFSEWLNDAINRLPSISERLEDYIKTEWANTEKKDKANPAPTIQQRLDSLSKDISSNNAMTGEIVRRNREARKSPYKTETFPDDEVIKPVWDRLFNEARAIFIEAGKQNITLPIVPAGGDSLKDFQILQGWVDDSLCKISIPQEQTSGKAGETTTPADTELKPIKVLGLWNCLSLKSLMDIDSNAKGEGIDGDKVKLKRLQEYLRDRHKRPDLAETLFLEDGKIKTRLPYRSMFSK